MLSYEHSTESRLCRRRRRSRSRGMLRAKRIRHSAGWPVNFARRAGQNHLCERFNNKPTYSHGQSSTLLPPPPSPLDAQQTNRRRRILSSAGRPCASALEGGAQFAANAGLIMSSLVESIAPLSRSHSQVKRRRRRLSCILARPLGNSKSVSSLVCNFPAISLDFPRLP